MASATEEVPVSRAARRPSEGLDEIDRALIASLQRDGRTGNRALAAEVGANEVTVANRLKRLEESAITRVVAVADMAAFGRTEMVMMLVRVTGRAVQSVAEDIATHDDVIAVTITTGRFDLVVMVLARDHGHVGAVLGDVRLVAGVDFVRCEVSLEVMKYESNWAKLEPDSDLALPLVPTGSIDELDVAIVRELQRDARQSNRRIAAALGVVEGTVRLRLKRMYDDGAIRIQAISDIVAFGLGAHAYVGIDVVPGRLEEVSSALSALDNVAVLIRSLGEFDLVAVVYAQDRWELISMVLQQMSATSGVVHTETMESFMTVKHTASWVRILSNPE